MDYWGSSSRSGVKWTYTSCGFRILGLGIDQNGRPSVGDIEKCEGCQQGPGGQGLGGYMK